MGSSVKKEKQWCSRSASSAFAPSSVAVASLVVSSFSPALLCRLVCRSAVGPFPLLGLPGLLLLRPLRSVGLLFKKKKTIIIILIFFVLCFLALLARCPFL